MKLNPGHAVVQVNGKDYIVAPPGAGMYGVPGRKTRVTVDYCYWSTRNGEYYGPVRSALLDKVKPGSVGAQIIAAAQPLFGADHEAMIAAEEARWVEIRSKYASAP